MAARLLDAVPVQGAFRDRTPILSFRACSPGETPRTHNCGWTGAYVGICRRGERVSLERGQPVMARVCKGIHGCDRGQEDISSPSELYEVGTLAKIAQVVQLQDGTVRAIVRFPYAHGAEVAATLKAEVIRRSSTRRVLPGGNRRRAAPTLRVRLDDAEPFTEV